MSTKLDPADFSRARDRAVRALPPASFNAQNAWLEDWKFATDRMHYLHIEQLVLSESLKTLIRIRGSLKRPNLSLELVKPDVETLWSEMSEKTVESAHSIQNIETGFECSFLAILETTYITGSFVVNRHGATRK